MTAERTSLQPMGALLAALFAAMLMLTLAGGTALAQDTDEPDNGVVDENGEDPAAGEDAEDPAAGEDAEDPAAGDDAAGDDAAGDDAAGDDAAGDDAADDDTAASGADGPDDGDEAGDQAQTDQVEAPEGGVEAGFGGAADGGPSAILLALLAGSAAVATATGLMAHRKARA